MAMFRYESSALECWLLSFTSIADSVPTACTVSAKILSPTSVLYHSGLWPDSHNVIVFGGYPENLPRKKRGHILSKAEERL